MRTPSPAKSPRPPAGWPTRSNFTASPTDVPTGYDELWTQIPAPAKRRRASAQDDAFVALADGAFADAASRSGPHLLCREGCAQCCIGVFAIGPADALRLKHGLAILQLEDPARAIRVQQRAAASWWRLVAQFPGDAACGLLHTDSEGEPAAEFADFGNDEPCPVLDPEHGRCELYASRPQTCRLFGPPVETPEGYGVCELCFHHATEEEIADAAIAAPSAEISAALDLAAMAAGEPAGPTIVAFVLKS
jgi:Fe-S-cluster containining protein